MNLINNNTHHYTPHLLVVRACSRSSVSDTGIGSQQPTELKKHVRIGDADPSGQPKLQGDQQPEQPGLPLFNRKLVPGTLILNQPNGFQEELAKIKYSSTNYLRSYIEQMLAEEVQTEAWEAWAEARKKEDFVKSLRATTRAQQASARKQMASADSAIAVAEEQIKNTIGVWQSMAKARQTITLARAQKEAARAQKKAVCETFRKAWNEARKAKDEALQKFNEAQDKIYNAWPGEAQPINRTRISQRRQSLADNPCFRLFQELNIHYFQTPSLNIRNNLKKLGTWALYPLTGQRPKPCPASPRRPLLAAMYELCQQYQDITLEQLMATLDNQPQEKHSEAVQALLRFRNNPWSPEDEEEAAEDRQTLSNAETGESVAGFANPQTEELPDHARGNRWQQSGKAAKPPVMADTTQKDTTELTSPGKSFQTTLFQENKESVPTLSNEKKESANALICPTIPWQPGGFSNTAATLLLIAVFENLLGGSGAHKFRSMVGAKGDRATVKIAGIYNICREKYHFGKGRNQKSDFCERFCIAQSFNGYYTPSNINLSVCRSARSSLDSLLHYLKDHHPAQHDKCFVKEILPSSKHNCMNTLADLACKALQENFSNQTACDFCNAAVDTTLRCLAPPRATSFSRVLKTYNTNINNTYSLAEACEQNHLPELCNSFCIANITSTQNKYQQPWAMAQGDFCTHSHSHINRMFSMDIASDYGCKFFDTDETVYLHPDSGQCLYKYAYKECTSLHNNGIQTGNDTFCELCNSARDPQLFCDPLPDAKITESWVSDTETIPLDLFCEDAPVPGKKSKLCDNFCITKALDNNRYRQTGWANEIGPIRCASASDEMTQWFPMELLIKDYDCEVIRYGNSGFQLIGDDTCLNNYVVDQCRELNANGTQSTESRLFQLCNAAKDKELHYHPLPDTITHFTREIPLYNLCNSTHSEPSQAFNLRICSDYCLNPEGHSDIPGSICLNAAAAIGSVFDLNIANNRYNCQAQWDSVAWVNPEQADCLVEYLNQECLAMVEGGNTTGLLCDVCDSANNGRLHCHPKLTPVMPVVMTIGAMASIVYLGYQWCRGYQESGLSGSMLARPLLPLLSLLSPKIRPDAPQPDAGQTAGYLPLSRKRPTQPQPVTRETELTDCLPLARKRPDLP